MILLGWIEDRGRQDLGHDGAGQLARLFQRCLRGFGLRTFAVIADEDRCAVLRALVAKLAGRVDRVDIMPEHIEQLFVADARRIVFDLQRFIVAGASRRHLLVGRIDLGAAGITGGGGEDAVDLVESRLDAPETTAGEHGCGARLRLGGGKRDNRQQGRERKPDLFHQAPAAVGLKIMATPFMQYRRPVGFGPSSNTWPRWPPQRRQ